MTKGEFAMVSDSGRSIPDDKKWKPSTRKNSVDKWNKGGAIGALEVPSEPYLQLKGTYKPMIGISQNDEDLWNKAQQAWTQEQLRSDLIDASESLPIPTCCCGLLTNEDQKIKDMVPYLNKHFIPKANGKLKDHGFKIDAFLWLIHNIEGKSETLILLLRFFATGDRGDGQAQ